MKTMKKCLMLFAIVTIVSVVGSAEAALVNGQNWADSVVSYTSKIQNYNGILMSSSTESWVTGPSDADQNGNMYAWDEGDLDCVAGWRAGAANQEIIVGFDTALEDVAGEDLVIRMYCGPNSQASVYVSEDNSVWTNIGTISGTPGQVPGSPGYLYDAAFDFSGLFSGDAYYVKVHRDIAGPQTGMFFDSFASAVPEPATMLILGMGAFCLKRKK